MISNLNGLRYKIPSGRFSSNDCIKMIKIMICPIRYNVISKSHRFPRNMSAFSDRHIIQQINCQLRTIRCQHDFTDF